MSTETPETQKAWDDCKHNDFPHIAGVMFEKSQALERRNSELTARIAELEKERDEADRRAGSAERLRDSEVDSRLCRERWLREAKEQWGVDRNVSFDVVWDECLQLKAALAEARKDGQRLDAIIANKWTVTWNHLRDSFIIQSVNQVCGNIGHSKPLRELLDDAAMLPSPKETL